MLVLLTLENLIDRNQRGKNNPFIPSKCLTMTASEAEDDFFKKLVKHNAELQYHGSQLLSQLG